MKTYECVTPYSQGTFRFELKSVLGTVLDECVFNGVVEQNSFQIRRNYTSVSSGLPRPVFHGQFREENGFTRVYITPKPRKSDVISEIIMRLLFLVVGVVLLFGNPDGGILVAIMYAICVWTIGALFFAIQLLAFWISTRLALKKLEKALHIELYPNKQKNYYGR